jgi:pyruvate dehydrogenase E2 component (dihydrolipoamide acetyltransferase)
MNFKLPDIGEGIKDVTVTDVLVKNDQEVNKNDNVIIVESEKTSMEIPIDQSGKVQQIHVDIGSQISPGDLIISLVSNDNQKVDEDKEVIENKDEKSKENSEDNIFSDKKDLVSEFDKPTFNEKSIDNHPNFINSNELSTNEKTIDNNIIYTSPSVRKLARELNCDLSQIKGTGRNGRITIDDVKNNKQNISNLVITDNSSEDKTDDIFNSASRWGFCEKIDLNNIKKTTGKRLHKSWTDIPHVTQFDECDITDLDNIRKIIKSKDKNSKVSFISFFIRAVSIVLRDIPIFNTSLSDSKDYMIQKNYFNIGVAVDTSRGLVVPVIKDVNKKSIKKINFELLSLIDKAKNNKLTIEDMSGGCFTITSLGNIGGKYFTPIINPPEVAILGLSKISIQPVFIKGRFKPRKILPLSLSYDHRIIDGAAAASFTNLFSKLISNPKLLNG